jgi:hypothetical protein
VMRLEFCVKTCEPGLVKYEPRVKLEPTGRVMRSRLERLMVSLRVAVKRRLTGSVDGHGGCCGDGESAEGVGQQGADCGLAGVDLGGAGVAGDGQDVGGLGGWW